ncbi:AAA family ATPase [Planococcus koreensis]|uniref:AAA family ATPase n=1 Tax=Planococcus koreensis TaxID=112331 RepID=UPI0039FBE8D4
MRGRVYIVSGPAGIGKSTTARKLAEELNKSAYISGDIISHMPVSGREKPWESNVAQELIWKNIISLTNNFLAADYDVIIDWIAFWTDVEKYTLQWIERGIEVRFVVLWAEKDIHLNRDSQRPAHFQMGERVLILRNEFHSSEIQPRFFLDNTTLNLKDAVQIIQKRDDYLVT